MERGRSQLTLAAALRIEGPGVVVDYAWLLLIYILVEGLSAEQGEGSLCVESPVE